MLVSLISDIRRPNRTGVIRHAPSHSHVDPLGIRPAVAGCALRAPVAAETVSAIRVRLHPYTAPAGALPLDALAKLQALTGLTLTLTGTTRTGALELGDGRPSTRPRWPRH